MYGKLFASCFTGSMYGAGPVVFAVWGYVLANTGRDGTVEVNVRAVANALGAPEEEVAAALAYLLAPDGESRSQAEHGRRLVQVDQYRYRVVNYETYRTIRNEDELRAYNRDKQRESRARKRERQPKAVKTPVNDIADKTGEVNDSQPRIEDRGERVEDRGERVEVRGDGSGEKGIPRYNPPTAGGKGASETRIGDNPETRGRETRVSTQRETRVSTKRRKKKGKEEITPPAKRVTWLTPYWDAWVARYGGEPVAGQLAKSLKPLHDQHGEPETVARWREYLRRTEAAFASPARFAATFGTWAPGAEPMSELGFGDDDFDN